MEATQFKPQFPNSCRNSVLCVLKSTLVPVHHFTTPHALPLFPVFPVLLSGLVRGTVILTGQTRIFMVRNDLKNKRSKKIDNAKDKCMHMFPLKRKSGTTVKSIFFLYPYLLSSIDASGTGQDNNKRKK